MLPPPFTGIDSNITTTVCRKLSGKTNKPVPLHDPGHLGAHTGFPIRSPADEAMAGIGTALAPLKGTGEDGRRLMGHGEQALALIKLHSAVVLVSYPHVAIPISMPGA